jgi:hypothetical protein
MVRQAVAPRVAGVTEVEICRLEERRLVIPGRSWKTLWLVPYDHVSPLEVIRRLGAWRRTSGAALVREAGLRFSEDERRAWA